MANAAQAAVQISAAFVESPLEEVLDMLAVGLGDPAVGECQFGQRGLFVRGPERADLDKLPGVDQAGLQCNDAEQQVAIGLHRSVSDWRVLRSQDTRIARQPGGESVGIIKVEPARTFVSGRSLERCDSPDRHQSEARHQRKTAGTGPAVVVRSCARSPHASAVASSAGASSAVASSPPLSSAGASASGSGAFFS